ncbi:alcohol dehydrogenase [Niveomyces insectorum RCEF 264]|uniref:Alcohol dehydrogenase n=1 Tax=Niveomyces insectorum RCEF 264 TaxID=1081102 RepID=A0A167SGT0_9HYPO|nr:alcohol dehydrogenase [Niveomyces insectorum RCEF 264]
MSCLSVVLAERPTAAIVPGQTFRTESHPVPSADDLQPGQLLVMRGAVVARVLASRSDKYAVGDTVVAYAGWTEMAIVGEAAVESSLHAVTAGLPADAAARIHGTDLLNVLGPTGRTAYFGLAKVAGGVRPTDTVVVSGAAGATGSVVGQLAKLQGAKRWLVDELGFDVGINYKDADFAAQLKAATPDYIDVYWDNVGGDVLDAALARANTFARFVMCGGISQYNSTAVQGPRNILQVVTQRVKMQGFIVFDYAKEYPAANKELAQWLAAGKIKSKETIVKGGLRAAEQALVGLYNGVNTGKLLVEVKTPEEAAKL